MAIATSVIGMENWLPKPAGAHGHVKIVGDHLEFADGTPAKFWGTNLCYGAASPPQADADFTAARFAKYGVNCVRFHKFLERGVADRNDWTKLAADGVGRMDYFAAALAKQGVYYTFSPFFGFEVKPANKDRVLAYDEIVASKGRFGNAYGLVNYAEDIQDLVAEMYKGLLTHKNPTGSPHVAGNDHRLTAMFVYVGQGSVSGRKRSRGALSVDKDFFRSAIDHVLLKLCDIVGDVVKDLHPELRP